MPLHEMVFDKKFRQDLLYRINTVEIRVPSLRERADDIPLLAEHFLARYAQKYKRPGMKLDKTVLSRLKKYAWPGNIRELQHAVERAVILTEGKVIASEGLLTGGAPRPLATAAPQTLEEMEKVFIQQALANHQGNVSTTARTLGLTRTALYRRMKRHGI